MARVRLWKGATPTGTAVAEVGNPDNLYRPVSGMLWIDEKYVTPRHGLYDYAEDDQPYVDEDLKGKRRLESFRFKGRQYALGQFMRIGWPAGKGYIELEDGTALEGYDATDYYKPYLLEMIGEEFCVRLWERVEKGEEA